MSDTAPPEALRAAFGRTTGPYDATLNRQLHDAIKLHPQQFWTVYLQAALDRIKELEHDAGRSG